MQKLTYYRCRWSIGSCDTKGLAKLTCQLGLKCPCNAVSCGKFEREIGTMEPEDVNTCESI